MNKYLYTGIFSLAFMGVLLVPGAQAHEGHSHSSEAIATLTTTQSEQIKALMAKIEELKKQLEEARGEIRSILKTNIAEGTTSDDVKKIQEILATDENIYPEGLVTGYYGPLTKEALKRFQKRHELVVTGVIDEDTRTLLEEYLGERFGEKIPPGLLKAPGIMKKVELRAKEGCDNKGPGKGVLCTKLKIKYEDDEDEEDEDHDHDDEFDVEVEIEDDSTTVAFKFGGKAYTAESDSVSESDVLAAVAEALDVAVADLDEDLADAVKHALEEEVADEDEDDNSDATIRDAGKAIQKAARAIFDANEEVDEFDGDTSDAEELLTEARSKLALARKARTSGDYGEAVDLAEEAEDLAEEAEDAVDSDEDEDEDEDEA